MSTPFYFLSASVPAGNRVKGFFQEGSGVPARLLDHAPVFRYAGFDTSTGDYAKLIDGNHWEVRNGDRKLLQMFQDGTLLFRMAVDGNFLSWANPDGILNPVAVMESHTSFVHLYSTLIKVLHHDPEKVFFNLAFKNASFEGRRVGITKYFKHGLRMVVDPTIYPIHSVDATADLTVSSADLGKDPNRVAYDVLAAFYDLFDASPELIPFTKATDSGPAMDITALTNAGT